ncbi:MAG: family phosphatase [Ferruginibacter sp.]|nr:family phosphatase [Ferruginibacter sp.]
MLKKPAFLFDLNGTMINDMHYHIQSWHDILNCLGANISMEQMKAECYGKNEELLERMLPGRLSADEKLKMSFEKERAYQDAFRPELKLINGLHSFLKTAKEHHIRMAIGSAAIMFNIDFVLDGSNIRPFFDALVSADDVSFSKPHPETYLSCAALLGEDPANCIVFEDSPKGIESAANAGMRAVVLTTMHTKDEFAQYDNIICFAADYTDKQLYTLFSE